MNAVLAIIVDGGRAIVVIYREGVEINYFSFILLILLKPFNGGPVQVQPLARRLPGCSMFVHKNHAAGAENGSIMVGMFVFLCLASQKPSERDFFVPARADLGGCLAVKSPPSPLFSMNACCLCSHYRYCCHLCHSATLAPSSLLFSDANLSCCRSARNHRHCHPLAWT